MLYRMLGLSPGCHSCGVYFCNLNWEYEWLYNFLVTGAILLTSLLSSQEYYFLNVSPSGNIRVCMLEGE